jgi:hypothetical protein
VTKEELERKKRNKSIIERLMRGETLATVPQSATWFPPRPVIKKNQEALGKLYGYGHVWENGRCKKCEVLFSVWEHDKCVCRTQKKNPFTLVET